MITDPYKVLNIAPNASDEEVKKAYRDLARKYHPDHYHGTDLEHMAEEKMKEINEAYAVIDVYKRQVLSEGQTVEAKIIAIDEENKKISLSIRALLQDGADEAEVSASEEEE